jgi:hypothetical protein
MFWKKISYPSSGPKSKPSKKPEDAGSKQNSAYYLLLLVNPEDGGDIFL